MEVMRWRFSCDVKGIQTHQAEHSHTLCFLLLNGISMDYQPKLELEGGRQCEILVGLH